MATYYIAGTGSTGIVNQLTRKIITRLFIDLTPGTIDQGSSKWGNPLVRPGEIRASHL